MTDERWKELMDSDSLALTKEEVEEGWHFCLEFDGLLVKGDPNEKYCGQACIDSERGL